MGSTLLLMSALLMAPMPTATEPARGAKPCLCTESAGGERCGPERTTCYCVDSPVWMLVRFWASETSRCEELVFFLGDDEPELPQAQ